MIKDFDIDGVKKSLTEDEMKSYVESAVADLVYDKDMTLKAYNCYNCIMDKDQFRHLEENYGIGNPTSIEFIPLIRRHVDALVGEHLQNKLKPKITCKDKKTLTNIEKAKQLEIYKQEVERIKMQLRETVAAFLSNKENYNDVASEEELKRLKEDLEKDFISEYEIAAQYVLTHITQSKRIDLVAKLETLFRDLLVAGQCFYRVKLNESETSICIEVLNPVDVFYEKNYNSPYIKDSTRAVVRKYMNKQQILSAYGKYMNDEEIHKLRSAIDYMTNSGVYYVRGGNANMMGQTAITVAGVAPDTASDRVQFKDNLIPVYEIEWLRTENEDGKFITNRYEAVRIGYDIYLNMGKSEHVVRSVENPNHCGLSINGICYSDRNGKPYSLVTATQSLQDKYNLLHFYRDTLIANSGTKGDFLNVPYLPKFLGTTPEERILKYKAYKKAGSALIDTTMDGNVGAAVNTIFSGYDDTVSGEAITAIQAAITQTEEICSSITGVFREKLGAIEQRDAVTNVEVGLKQSAIITKQYYRMMDSITTELLIDSLNMAKIAYKNGFTGTVILGNKLQKTFTAMPEHFTVSDHDIHIADSGDIIRDMQKIEALTMELIKAGTVDVDLVLEGVTCESLTEMKDNVLSAFKKRKSENDAVKQLQQQIAQYEQNLKELQTQAQKLASENENLKKKTTDIEVEKLNKDYEIKKEANSIKRDEVDRKLTLEDKKMQLEGLQMFDNNPNNNEVRND